MKTILLTLTAVLSGCLASCTVSLTDSGKPQISLDPYSAKRVINGVTDKINRGIIDYSK